MVLDVDFAVGGGEDEVFSAAFELQVAFGFLTVAAAWW